MFDIFFDHLVEPPDREVADFLVVQPKYMDATAYPASASCLSWVTDSRW